MFEPRIPYSHQLDGFDGPKVRRGKEMSYQQKRELVALLDKFLTVDNVGFDALKVVLSDDQFVRIFEEFLNDYQKAPVVLSDITSRTEFLGTTSSALSIEDITKAEVYGGSFWFSDIASSNKENLVRLFATQQVSSILCSRKVISENAHQIEICRALGGRSKAEITAREFWGLILSQKNGEAGFLSIENANIFFLEKMNLEAKWIGEKRAGKDIGWVVRSICSYWSRGSQIIYREG